MTESITDEAQRIVNGDRNDAYGDPDQDLADIGQAWSATLNAWRARSEHEDAFVPAIPARIVALMMIQLKVIRSAHRHHRDGLVDIVGYALCAERSSELGG